MRVAKRVAQSINVRRAIQKAIKVAAEAPTQYG